MFERHDRVLERVEEIYAAPRKDLRVELGCGRKNRDSGQELLLRPEALVDLLLVEPRGDDDASSLVRINSPSKNCAKAVAP